MIAVQCTAKMCVTPSCVFVFIACTIRFAHSFSHTFDRHTMHVLHHHPFTAILPRTRSFMQVAHAEERRLQFKFEVEDLTRKKAELVHDLDVKRAQVMAVLQPRIDQLTAQMEDIRYAVAFTLFFSSSNAYTLFLLKVILLNRNSVFCCTSASHIFSSPCVVFDAI